MKKRINVMLSANTQSGSQEKTAPPRVVVFTPDAESAVEVATRLQVGLSV